jgi:hypothetical protein
VAAVTMPALAELLVQNNLFTGTMPPAICSLRTTGVLINLFSDCGGATPEIECTFPICCNRCFEGGQITDQRKRSLLQLPTSPRRPPQRDDDKEYLFKIFDRRWNNREHRTVTLTGET